MRPIRLAAVAAILAAALAACSSAHPTVNRSPQTIAPALTARSATPSATSAPATTTVDPCQLVTPQEASALTGASYGPGKLEIDSSAARRCIYGYQTKHVFEVIFVRAASAAQAKAYAGALRAQAQQQMGSQVTLAKVTGIGDDAESLRGNGSGIDVSGLYVVQGAIGFGLVDVAVGRAASTSTLMTQAQTTLGRLP